MSGREDLLTSERPFAGLRPFLEADREYFHGRDRETQELLACVERDLITVLFGTSGLGKSSLLHAGFFPLLRERGYFPVSLRLDYRSRSANLLEQVHQDLVEQYQAHGVQARAPGRHETLWEYFHNAAIRDSSGNSLRPVLVFDQFEELFTLGRSDHQSRAFVQEIADVAQNHIPEAVALRVEMGQADLPTGYETPKAKIVLALREDHLADLERLRTRIPEIGENRFRLLPMDGMQARGAILKQGGDLVDREVAEQILRFVGTTRPGRETPEGDGSDGTPLDQLDVEPFLMSLVCSELNERRIDESERKISATMLERSGEAILQDFYERNLQDLPAPVREFVENRLITEDGHRTPESLDDALKAGFEREHVTRLVNRRIVRETTWSGVEHLELIHDRLAAVVKEYRDQRAAKRQRRRIVALVGTLAGLVALGLGIGILLYGQWQGAERKREEANTDLSRAQGEIARANVMMANALLQMGRDAIAGARFDHALLYVAKAYELREGQVDRATRLRIAETVQRVRMKRMTLPGHQSAITRAAFSSDGRLVATCGSDKKAFVWDLETGERREMRGHEGEVNDVAFSPDGRHLVTVSEDYTVRIWNTANGTQRAVLGKGEDKHTGSIRRALFSDDGRYVISASWDGSARWWDWENDDAAPEKVHLEADDINCVTRADGTNRFLLCSDTGRVLIWGPETDEKTLVATHVDAAGDVSWVMEAQMDPTHRRIAARLLDGTVSIWDVGVEERRFLLEDISTEEEVEGAWKGISCFAFSPDGERIATGVGSGDVYVWSMATGLPLYALRGEPGVAVRQVLYTPDGRHVLTGSAGGQIMLWESRLALPIWRLEAHDAAVPALRLSADGRYLVSGGADGSAYLWDLEVNLHPRERHAPVATRTDIASSPDGRRLLVCRQRGSVEVLDVASPETLTVREVGSSPVLQGRFAPDGRALAAAAADGEVVLWDWEGDGPSRSPRLRRSVGERAPTALRFAADAATLWVGDEGGAVHGWERESGSALGPYDAGEAAVVDLRAADGAVWALTAAADVVEMDAASGEVRSRTGVGGEGLAPVGLLPDPLRAVLQREGGALVLRTIGEGSGEPRLLPGHGGRVLDWTASGDGSRLLTIGEGGTARLWSTADGEELEVFDVERYPNPQCALSAGGEALFLLDHDGNPRVLSQGEGAVLEGNPKDVLTGGPYRFCAYSPDGALALTGGGAEPTAQIWTLDASGVTPYEPTTRLEGHETGVQYGCFDPTGRLVGLASDDRTATVWEVESGNLRQRLEGHEDIVWSIRFDPEGRRAVTSSGDATARVWDVETGESVGTLSSGDSQVFFADWSPDGRWIATAHADGRTVLWDADSLAIRKEMQEDWQAVGYLAFRPDGEVVATAGGATQIRLWSVPEGRLLRSLEGHTDWVHAVAWNADGRLLASASQDTNVRIFDAQEGGVVGHMDLYDTPVMSVTFHPRDPLRFFTVSEGGRGAILDLEAPTGEAGMRDLREDPKDHAVLVARYDDDGARYLTAITEGPARLRDAETGEVLSIVGSGSRRAVAADYNPRTGRVAIALDDGTCAVWSTEGGDRTDRVRLYGPEQTVSDIALSLDGTKVAATDDTDHVWVWDATRGERIADWQTDNWTLAAVAFSPDGARLLTAGDSVKVWDLERREDILTLPAPGGTVRAACYSDDGSLILTASDDGTARVWDARTGKERTRPLRSAQVAGLWAVRFSRGPVPDLVAAGDDHGAVHLWDVKTGQEVYVLTGLDGTVTSVDFHPDGTRLLAGGWDGSVVTFHLEGEDREPEAVQEEVRRLVPDLRLSEEGLVVPVEDEEQPAGGR